MKWHIEITYKDGSGFQQTQDKGNSVEALEDLLVEKDIDQNEISKIIIREWE